MDAYSNKIRIKKINKFIILTFEVKSFFSTNFKFWRFWKKYYTYTFITYYLKIIWRGKAYRVRLFKKSSKFTFNFGHSHWCKMTFSTPVKFFRLKRQSYLALASTKTQVREIKDFFKSIRIYNRYTRRGIRLKKSPYIRRFGKISQVNSILHSF